MESPETASTGLPMKYWDLLPEDDKQAYTEMRNTFYRDNTPTKVRHPQTFQNDLNQIRNYIKRRPEQQDVRAIVSGIYFGGKFVCINTRQLKYLIGRCKSSINNGLLNMGYISSKQRVRQVLVSVIPLLEQDLPTLRQWTLRSAEPKINPIILPKISITPTSLPKANPPIFPKRQPLPMPMINMAPPKPRSRDSSVTFSAFPEREKTDFLMMPSPEMIQRDYMYPAPPMRPKSTPIDWSDHNFMNPMDDFGMQPTLDEPDPDYMFDTLKTDNGWFF